MHKKARHTGLPWRFDHTLQTVQNLFGPRKANPDIRAKAPSVYLADFADENSELKHALKSHLIELDDASIIQNDFTAFLKKRSEALYAEILKRIEPSEASIKIDPVHEMILEGEGQLVEFKSTLRYDMRTGEVNKKLEHVIAKTVAAFMNSDGGSLFIGVDDHGNAIGLDLDYGTLKKADRDGFQLHVGNILDSYLGVAFSSPFQHMIIT